METQSQTAALAVRNPATNWGQGVLLMISGGAFLGTVGLFVQQAGQQALTAVFFRCVVGGLALFAYALVSGRRAELKISGAGLRVAVTTGVLMLLNWVFFFVAINDTSIAMATVAFHIQPLWVMAFGMFFLGESATSKRILAAIAVLVGLGLATGLVLEHTTAWNQKFASGLGAALAASLCYAGVTLIAKTQRRMSAFALAWWQCVVGAVLLAWWPWIHGLPQMGVAWLWLIGLGIVPTAISYVLLYSGMRHLQAGQIALLQFVYPITAILVDRWVFGHTLSLAQWAGVAMMGIALRIAGPTTRQARR